MQENLESEVWNCTCSSELRSTSVKGQARAAAERSWLKAHSSHGLPAHIFRLGGMPNAAMFGQAMCGQGFCCALQQMVKCQSFWKKIVIIKHWQSGMTKLDGEHYKHASSNLLVHQPTHAMPA